MSNDQLTQLSDRIDKQSRSFDEQFTKLYKYMERRFQGLEERVNQTVTKTEFNRYTNLVDTLVQQNEIFHHEMLALGHQVERHDGWIHRVAQATNTELSA